MDALTLDELRRLLRLLADEPDSDPMHERLMEMYREWWRSWGVVPSPECQIPKRLALLL